MKKGIVFQYGMYVAILIAAVTFSDIALAIWRIVRAARNHDNESKTLSLISLATALISLTLTQTAILSFVLPERDMSTYNGICGMIFGMIAAGIGIIIVTKYHE